jgi:hypothetical protein
MVVIASSVACHSERSEEPLYLLLLLLFSPRANRSLLIQKHTYFCIFRLVIGEEPVDEPCRTSGASRHSSQPAALHRTISKYGWDRTTIFTNP